jgi:hypothetical protein
LNRRDWVVIGLFLIVAVVAMRFIGMAFETKP